MDMNINNKHKISLKLDDNFNKKNSKNKDNNKTIK
jgi:hypothetical protein